MSRWNKPYGDERMVFPPENNPMGYWYRARVIKTRPRMFSKKPWVCHIDQYFMDWKPYRQFWYFTAQEAMDKGNDYLDRLAGPLPGVKILEDDREWLTEGFEETDGTSTA